MNHFLAALLAVGALAATAAADDDEASELIRRGDDVAKRSLAKQEALIAPYIEVFTPSSGEAPFPAVLQFHGCTGYQPDTAKRWADIATEEGYIVIAVDSNGPRHINYKKSLSSVCGGKALLGQERAGDVAAAVAIATDREDVDAAHIVLAGWSHGGWTVMDYLALSAADIAPSSLKERPPAFDPAGIALFYPYCGPGSWSRIEPWRTRARGIAFIAGNDRIVDGPECKAQIEKIASEGVDIELAYYPNAGHGFDNPGPDGKKAVYLKSKKAAADAAARYRAFLRDIKARP